MKRTIGLLVIAAIIAFASTIDWDKPEGKTFECTSKNNVIVYVDASIKENAVAVIIDGRYSATLKRTDAMEGIRYADNGLELWFNNAGRTTLTTTGVSTTEYVCSEKQ
ncbi:MAG: hypothetical protein FWD15_01955 [Alphaproteobacteria bacterium]|nr:hypothetical protein [Alphaproteobacteria bacterium]